VVTTFTDDELSAFRAHDQLMAEAREQEAKENHGSLSPEPEAFTDEQTDAIAYVIVELRKEWREERDEAITPLKAAIADLKGKLDAVAELKGKVDALLTLLQGAKAEVIALPRKRPSDAA
jgi:hypothetical protein